MKIRLGVDHAHEPSNWPGGVGNGPCSPFGMRRKRLGELGSFHSKSESVSANVV